MLVHIGIVEYPDEILQALQEKICIVLGTIGSPEALPTLTEIAESKSFLGIWSLKKSNMPLKMRWQK